MKGMGFLHLTGNSFGWWLWAIIVNSGVFILYGAAVAFGVVIGIDIAQGVLE